MGTKTIQHQLSSGNEAVKWYRLAAEQGAADAQTNLGFIYDSGKGVLQDDAMAHMWYNIGAANGKERNWCVSRDGVPAVQHRQPNLTPSPCCAFSEPEWPRRANGLIKSARRMPLCRAENASTTFPHHSSQF